jgi:hypothetical protein
MADYDPYEIQLSYTWRARLDLRLVLANMRVLFGLVMTQSSHAGDSVVESMLVVARLGASADRQGAIGDHQGATVDRTGATGDHQGAVIERLRAAIDLQGVADIACRNRKSSCYERC